MTESEALGELNGTEQERLGKLATVSIAENVAFVEIVYQNRYVRFDVTEMQMRSLTAAQLLDRVFRQPFADVGLPLSAASDTNGQE